MDGGDEGIWRERRLRSTPPTLRVCYKEKNEWGLAHSRRKRQEDLSFTWVIESFL